MEGELQHAERFGVADFAVGLDPTEPFETLPTGADDKLADTRPGSTFPSGLWGAKRS
jgi:hypothetical protein